MGQMNLDAVSFQLRFGDELFRYLNFNYLGRQARYNKLLSSSHFMIRYVIIHCTLTNKCKMIIIQHDDFGYELFNLYDMTIISHDI